MITNFAYSKSVKFLTFCFLCFIKNAPLKILRLLIQAIIPLVLPHALFLKQIVAFNGQKIYNINMSKNSEKTRAKNGNSLKYVFLALYILFAAATIFTSCRPGAASENDSSVFTAIISAIKPLNDFGERYGDFEGLLRKLCGHYALFAASGVFFALTIYFFRHSVPLAIYLSFVSGIMLGAVNETIQYFVPLRNGSVTDVILDAHGYFIGAAITLLLITVSGKNTAIKSGFSWLTVCALLSVAIDLFYLFGGEKSKNLTVTVVFGNTLLLIFVVISLIVLFIKKRRENSQKQKAV